ncbi:MAG: toll/interleukin-1 receptor domain-containing protein [Prevotella sp.]|nr:toll/interleukin-1 receptor domain-containing protein [Prevotella sp.]
MARIFISYKRKNKDQVFPIVDYIERELGVKCWVDLDGIESSAQFASVICKAIDSADVILFMHSSVHLNIDFETDWTIKELNYAQAKKKRVVLVKLDSSPLDNIFLMDYGTKNNIDSRDSVQLQKLISDLRNWLALPNELNNNSKKEDVKVESGRTDGNVVIINESRHKAEFKEIAQSQTTSEELKLCYTYIDMVIHKKANVLEVKKQIETLARKGKTEAEYALGFGEYYPYGINIRVGGDTHYNDAEQWLKRAANKGHVKAQATLADMYYWGQEHDKAIPWAISASEKNDLKAAQILAWCYLKKNDNKRYVDAIKKASQIQEATKQRTIHCPAMEYGKALLEGFKIKKDLDEAVRWLDIAINLSYDARHKSDAIYYKARALYEQGHKLKALWCLGDSSDKDYRASELNNKIKSELNPISRLFNRK